MTLFSFLFDSNETESHCRDKIATQVAWQEEKMKKENDTFMMLALSTAVTALSSL